MSYVLRHNPADIDIALNGAGWVDFDRFVTNLQTVGGLDVSVDEVLEVIETNDKARFQLVDGRIRAAQGHSVNVELELEPIEPPDILWHGSVERFMDSIAEHGLRPGERTHVHLSDSTETAKTIGARRGKPVVLAINASAMQQAGHFFYCSANGVWLTAEVPPQFISVSGRPIT